MHCHLGKRELEGSYPDIGGCIRVMLPLRDTEDGVIGLRWALARCTGKRMDVVRYFSGSNDRRFWSGTNGHAPWISHNYP